MFLNVLGPKLKIMSMESKIMSMESKDKAGGKKTGNYAMAAFKSRGQIF